MNKENALQVAELTLKQNKKMLQEKFDNVIGFIEEFNKNIQKLLSNSKNIELDEKANMLMNELNSVMQGIRNNNLTGYSKDYYASRVTLDFIKSID